MMKLSIADALSVTHTAHSAVSWGGFNVYGDEKSIRKVRRLIEMEARLRWFEREYNRLVNEKLARRPPYEKIGVMDW
jgi:hypothetical protein